MKRTRQRTDLFHRVEDLGVGELIAKLRVEALAEAVLVLASQARCTASSHRCGPATGADREPRTPARCQNVSAPARLRSPLRRPEPRSPSHTTSAARTSPADTFCCIHQSSSISALSAELLSLRHLQALATPDSLDPVFAHAPAVVPKQRRDPTICVTSIIAGEIDDVSGESIFVLTRCRSIALRAGWFTS